MCFAFARPAIRDVAHVAVVAARGREQGGEGVGRVIREVEGGGQKFDGGGVPKGGVRAGKDGAASDTPSLALFAPRLH
ncbi:hypothetical protein E2C01_032149 [Portunus trituberculatus]|uniref:Uncharacterized protein n=1 Tax=Portunus trituberculatus TaxID=210409 RepID=A0A5B7F072_PORTR|nr:hypothetical protein [Portunus trituberculatus]